MTSGWVTPSPRCSTGAAVVVVVVAADSSLAAVSSPELSSDEHDASTIPTATTSEIARTRTRLPIMVPPRDGTSCHYWHGGP